MVTGVGALIMFAGDVDATVAFYRTIGIPLEEESHGEGDVPHYACDIGGCHVAVFPGEPGDGPASGFRSVGSAFAGFVVSSVEDAVAQAMASGAPLIEEPVQRHWGVRALVGDPDGRVVELYCP